MKKAGKVTMLGAVTAAHHLGSKRNVDEAVGDPHETSEKALASISLFSVF